MKTPILGFPNKAQCSLTTKDPLFNQINKKRQNCSSAAKSDFIIIFCKSYSMFLF